LGSRKKGNWSAAELDRLKVLYPKCPEDRVSVLLNRSAKSVRRRARAIFQRSPKRGAWTADDDHRLRVAYGVLGTKEISLVLARSERDVLARVEVLRSARRRGPWSAREIALLKQLYGIRTDEDLEVCLSRSARQIAKVATDYCLSKDKRFEVQQPRSDQQRRKMPRWTAAEESRLEELYPDHDNLEIARLLGRSVLSVANKASQLGMRKSLESLRQMGRKNVAIRYAE